MRQYREGSLQSFFGTGDWVQQTRINSLPATPASCFGRTDNNLALTFSAVLQNLWFRLDGSRHRDLDQDLEKNGQGARSKTKSSLEKPKDGLPILKYLTTQVSC